MTIHSTQEKLIKMNKEDLFEQLSFLKEEAREKLISLYVTAGGDVQLFNMVQEDLDELLPVYMTLIEQITEREGLQVGDYSTSLSRNDMIYVYDLDEDRRTTEMKQMVAAGSVVNPVYFECDSKSLEKIDGLYVVITDGNHRVVLYKQILPVEKTYGCKTILFGCKSDKTMFERKKDSLLRITPGIQMMYVGDSILLIEMQRLEKAFGLDAILQKESKATIQSVLDKHIIEETAKLTEACTKPSMLKKLRHALSEGRTKDLGVNEIVEYAKTHKKLKFKFNEAGDKFNLDSRAAAERFIKLLDDDYLFSRLTQTEYDSEQKGIFKEAEE